jgi:hypothetical protein
MIITKEKSQDWGKVRTAPTGNRPAISSKIQNCSRWQTDRNDNVIQGGATLKIAV